MKVTIGPYKNWFGPYQLAEAICWWTKSKPDEYGTYNKPDWVHSFGDWLAHGNTPDESHLPRGERLFTERPNSWLYRLLLWINNKRKRKIKIHIDKWDTWNMNDTLSLLVLPMLKQLQLHKHGAAIVDDSDVPDHLKSTAAPPVLTEFDNDQNFFKRWDWVLDELIWTFTQLQPDNDWQEQYRSGTLDMYVEPCKYDELGKPVLYSMLHGPDCTYKLDLEGMKAHQDRINNGLRLFGKYYQNLWD